jgi:hypothetical protein
MRALLKGASFVPLDELCLLLLGSVGPDSGAIPTEFLRPVGRPDLRLRRREYPAQPRAAGR